MRHTTKKLITLSIYGLFMTALYGGYIGSLSWFDNKSTLPDDFMGESARAFFGGGDGTSSNPYQINNARHFYNLCWLQYLGRFNRDTDNDGKINQIYFSLENDIDCKDLDSALPPIGTTRYPFVGNFNGNDHIISNYKITDEYSELKKHPSIIDTEDTYYKKGNTTINYCSIIGTFGVIGYNTTGATDVLSSETSLYDFSKDQLKVNSVDNLYIDNVTIKPTTKNTLAGLLAGYVSANMSGCGVNYSKIDFSNGNTNISSDKFSGKLSNYSLIGDYNSTDYNWDGHSGQNNDWGGSIDFEMLNQRLTYIMANSTKSSYNYTSTAFNTNIYYTSSTAFDIASTSSQTAFLNDGTYLPLNVDTTNVTSTYYEKKSSEPTLKTNTGYIVGEGSGSNGYVRAMHNKTNKDNSVVNCSFYTLNSKEDNPTRDVSLASSNISFLWLDNDGNTYRIRDDNNKGNVSSYIIPSNYSSSYQSGIYKGLINSGSSKDNISGLNLVKYNDVKKNFISSLSAATTDNFYGSNCYLALNYIQLKSKTEPTVKTFSNITLNGKTGISYDLFTGGINYTLKKDGYMTMLCGISFQGGGVKGNLPDIYYVDSSSGTKTLKKIYKIISKGGKTTFKFDNSSLESDETLIFDLYKFSTGDLMEIGGIYYFEFPMVAGDYFMTRYDSTTKVYVPYIYYLDIGANAGDSGEDEKKGKLENIDFYYYENNQLVKVTADKASNVVFDISGDGSAVFYFNRILDIGVLYFDEDARGLTRSQPSTFTGTSVLATDKNCTTKAN